MELLEAVKKNFQADVQDLYGQIWALESLQSFLRKLPDSIDKITSSYQYKFAEICLTIQPFVPESQKNEFKLVNQLDNFKRLLKSGLEINLDETRRAIRLSE